MSAVQEQAPVATEVPTQRVPIGSPVYNQILEFLYDEACMLDEIRLKDWVATLAEDLVYTAPLRQTLGTAMLP